MLYLLNSNQALCQCMELIENTDSVIVFADTLIDENLLYQLCKKCNNTKIVDDDFICNAKNEKLNNEINSISLEIDSHRVPPKEAAEFIGVYRERIVSLM